MGQLLNVHLLLLVVVMRGNRANYVLRSFRIDGAKIINYYEITTKTKKKMLFTIITRKNKTFPIGCTIHIG
jgi:hypothetical protein